MANGYDGDIKLSVSLSPKDIKSSAQELSNQISNIFQKSSGKELNQKFQSLQTQMSKSVTKARELQNAMEELEKVQVPTEEYKEIQNQIDKASDSLVKLLERQEKFIETGGDTKSKTYLGMQYDVEQLRQTIEFAEGELQDLVDTGKAFKLGSDTEQYTQLASKLGDINNVMTTQVNAWNALEDAERGAGNTMSNTVSPAFEKIKGTLGTIASRAIGMLKNGLSSLIGKFRSAGKAAANFAGSLNLGKILSYAIGIRGLFALFGKLRSAIISGINTMAQFNGGVNTTNAALTQLVSSFNLVKGSIASAFAPLLTVVAPILSGFMQQLANVITMIGMFIAKLTGAKSYMKATFKSTDYAASLSKGGGSGKSAQEKYDKAVKKAQESYDKKVAKVTKHNEEAEAKAKEKNAKKQAKAEEKQAKAAEKLAKAQEKANNKLAAWDDLNVLGVESAEEELDALEDIEEVMANLQEMPELELPNLEDFLGGGAGGAGSPFGLEEIPLEDIDFNWDDLLEKAREFGEKFAKFLNEIFKDEDLAKKIGNAIGNIINLAIEFAYGFVNTFDFKQFGRWIGALIREAIETIEWDKLGETLGKLVNGIAEILIGFFETYPPGTLAKALVTMCNKFIEAIDPHELAQATYTLVNAIATEIATFFTQLDIKQLAEKIGTYINESIKGIDAEEVARAIRSVLVSAANFILTVFTTTDFYQLGSKIGEIISKALGDEELQQKIGEALASLINAAVQLLQGLFDSGMIDSITEFFQNTLETAIENIDVQALFDVLVDVLGKLAPLFTSGALPSNPLSMGEIHGTGELVQQLSDLKQQLDEGKISAEEYKTALDELGGASSTASTQSGELSNSILGVGTASDTVKDKSVSNSSTLMEAMVKGVGAIYDFFNKTETKTETFTVKTEESFDNLVQTAEGGTLTLKDATNNINEAVSTSSTNVNDFSDTTVESLDGVQSKFEETALDFEGFTELIQISLESVSTIIDEWFLTIKETYFSYEVWYMMLQEGMLTALEEALTVGWVEKWDTAIKDWWENHVKPWFSNEKWNNDIYTPWEKFRDTKWKALVKWWDDSMKNWWDEHVVPWFKEEKWKEQFEHVQKVAKEVAEATHKDVTEWVQQIEDFVVASCDTMIAKAEDLIEKLERAIELASQLAEMGGGSGGFSASTPTGSSSISGGGSSQGGGGGGSNPFMPRLDIMHFEDNLGMSAFRFPELATGAVIPPNNKFLAVLGDQKSGMNIETPLATMVDAFRTVMDEYMNPGYNNATMEVDGETFARLMLPHVMDEMHRQGYNTEIIEGV